MYIYMNIFISLIVTLSPSSHDIRVAATPRYQHDRHLKATPATRWFSPDLTTKPLDANCCLVLRITWVCLAMGVPTITVQVRPDRTSGFSLVLATCWELRDKHLPNCGDHHGGWNVPSALPGMAMNWSASHGWWPCNDEPIGTHWLELPSQHGTGSRHPKGTPLATNIPTISYNLWGLPPSSSANRFSTSVVNPDQPIFVTQSSNL